MPRATCRCGQELTFSRGGPSRMVCPKCGAKVKLKLSDAGNSSMIGDGFLRFLCPCGRRLKVSATNPPSHGQCPDCQRVVPVPVESITGPDPRHPETPTEDQLPTDIERLDAWKQAHRERRLKGPEAVLSEPPPPLARLQPPGGSTAEGPVIPRTERGLRVCAGCGRPLHMAAESCRHCGVPAPR